MQMFIEIKYQDYSHHVDDDCHDGRNDNEDQGDEPYQDDGHDYHDDCRNDHNDDDGNDQRHQEKSETTSNPRFKSPPLVLREKSGLVGPTLNRLS